MHVDIYIKQCSINNLKEINTQFEQILRPANGLRVTQFFFKRLKSLRHS